MNNREYNRLLELKQLIKNGTAVNNEKNEYMKLLVRNGNISKEQYDKFLMNQNSDDIINAALTIGGIVLAAWLITKLFNDE